MYNKLCLSIVLLGLLTLVACNNESSLPPEDDNLNPEYISFSGENETQMENQSRAGQGNKIPVNPGREQNIFTEREYDTNFNYRFENSNTEGQERQQRASDNTNDKEIEQQNNTSQATNQVVQQVIDLTNDARQRNGVSALQMDNVLNNVAQTKSEDMSDNNYFSHTSPTYGSPFDMLRTFGVDYTKASENIAAGQKSAEEVVQSWLNSEGHRRNMLDPDVTHIGVGFDNDGNYWTQMFIKK